MTTEYYSINNNLDETAKLDKLAREVNNKKTISITDRSEAIKTACSYAKQGDIILVAGKGHEKYQEIKGVKHDFDDMIVLQENLKLFEK
jgi:UDP-N-acetylmuramoyl-L-alanyl-D-glutamate--2,6-diaminopimelate ligase